jgi:heptosyltransferase III
MTGFCAMTEFRNVRKILVIKLRHIGDVLLTVPVFRALRETFPDAHISALINSGTEEVLSGNPLIDDIIVFNREIKSKNIMGKAASEISFLSGIRSKGFDMTVDLTSGDRAALISYMSGARYRLAYDPKDAGFPGKKLLYTHIAPKGYSPPHMVVQNLDLLRRFSINTGNLAVDFFIPRDAEEYVDRIFHEHSICGSDTVVHIHPTSRWLFKCWNDEYMAEVINWLAGKGMKVIITSSPDEKEIQRTRKIIGRIDDMTNVIDLSGRTNIKQLAAISARSKLFIGVDSAPMHIAAAVRTPVIALFGPTSEKHWGPWGSGHIVLKKSFSCNSCDYCHKAGLEVRRCLNAITPAEVIEAIKLKLNPGNNDSSEAGGSQHAASGEQAGQRMYRKKDINNILVVRMNRLGDMICTIPLLKTLKSEFPDALITVLAESSNAEVIKYEPYVDRVIVYRRPSGVFRSRILNILRALRGADFDLAIGVKGGFSSFLAWTTFLSGARYRIGYVSGRKRLLDRFYNMPVNPVDFGAVSQIDACLNLLGPLKITTYIKDININIPTSIEEEACNFLYSKGMKPKDKLAVFNISSTREDTSWSPDKFVGLGRLLIQTKGFRVIISGVPSDEEKALKICKEIGEGAFYFKTVDIVHFAAMTRLCNFLVTGEGGAGHTAAAAGAFVVSLFGPANYDVWRPCGERNISLKSKDRNANSITVGEVFEAIQSMGTEYSL